MRDPVKTETRIQECWICEMSLLIIKPQQDALMLSSAKTEMVICKVSNIHKCSDYGWLVGWLVVRVYGVATFVGYLMPNTF